LSRPSGQSGSYTGLIGFNPRRLKGPKMGMSSHAMDLSVYAKSSSSSKDDRSSVQFSSPRLTWCWALALQDHDTVISVIDAVAAETEKFPEVAVMKRERWHWAVTRSMPALLRLEMHSQAKNHDVSTGGQTQSLATTAAISRASSSQIISTNKSTPNFLHAGCPSCLSPNQQCQRTITTTIIILFGTMV